MKKNDYFNLERRKVELEKDIQNKDKIYLEKPKKLIKNQIVPKFINKME